MKILSWNLNGIRSAARKGFLSFLQTSAPDILCVQEVRAREKDINMELARPEGYYSYWCSAEKPGYSGTAIYSTHPLEISTMGIPAFDCEGRVISAALPHFRLINAYFPNSQDGGKRLDYKLAFCNAILNLCNTYTRNNEAVILCGDFNIAHKEIDLAHPKRNEKNPGFLPEERAWMDTFIAEGYVDTFRSFCQKPHHYTWWSFRGNARAHNTGWRIDYFCANSLGWKLIKNSTILSDVLGSDHCPVQLEIYDR